LYLNPCLQSLRSFTSIAIAWRFFDIVCNG
jgi:hypothetical protein